jgi:4-diphosphocytidyl-2-C-methyl-D-erythritol kinase
MRVRCPAKVNTFLSVGQRDSRGYHPLRTVFQAVGLFDDLAISTATEDVIVCDWSALPADNTMTKALRLLRELAPIPPLHIELTKRIPSEAGLGGGSSDAAGIIRFARKNYSETVSERFAREVAIAVGVDVPFFLVGGCARGTGYGEVLELLPDLPTSWLLIVKPEESVSTAEAYSALDSSPRVWKEFSDEPYNDFARVAPCVCGEIAERLQVHGASHALLCGSGSAVYGAFCDEASALKAKDRMAAEEFSDSWVAPTLTREESLWTS